MQRPGDILVLRPRRLCRLRKKSITISRVNGRRQAEKRFRVVPKFVKKGKRYAVKER